MSVEAWVDEYGDALYSFALKRTFNEALAKDLVQDTFVSAHQNIDRFRSSGKPLAWLFTILRNKITDYYRSAHHKRSASLDNLEHEDQLFYNESGHWVSDSAPKLWGDDAVSLMERSEFMNWLHNCLRLLPDKQQLAFQLKYLDGKDSTDIRKELDISASNYWVLIHRAKLALRDCLEKNWILK